MSNTPSPIREGINETLKKENLTFNEDNSRMCYGFIGHLKRNGKLVAGLYPETFYIHAAEFPLNENNLRLIRVIQAEFRELTRDADNKPIPVVLGIDAK